MAVEITLTGERAQSAEETWEQLEPRLGEFGIVRVFDSTPLDFIGVPVFSAVRPRSKFICVSTGKGITQAQARVSAAMEAAEIAVAERFPDEDELLWRSPREARSEWGYSIVDLCPILGRIISSDLKLPWVKAKTLAGLEIGVPAEAVYIPMPRQYGPSFLGCTTAGLGAGRTDAEAIAHALGELIERDVDSFDNICCQETKIRPKSLPPSLQGIDDLVTAAGLATSWGSVPNPYGLPFIRAAVFEPEEDDPLLVGVGIGVHPDAEVAAGKAILEAIQSRITVIHGGRDDVEDQRVKHAAMDSTERSRLVARMRGELESSVTDFEAIPSNQVAAASLVRVYVNALSLVGVGPAIVHQFMSSEDPIRIVRVIVPGMENMTTMTEKVGPRLARHFRDLRAKAKSSINS